MAAVTRLRPAANLFQLFSTSSRPAARFSSRSTSSTKPPPEQATKQPETTAKAEAGPAEPTAKHAAKQRHTPEADAQPQPKPHPQPEEQEERHRPHHPPPKATGQRVQKVERARPTPSHVSVDAEAMLRYYDSLRDEVTCSMAEARRVRGQIFAELDRQKREATGLKVALEKENAKVAPALDVPCE